MVETLSKLTKMQTKEWSFPYMVWQELRFSFNAHRSLFYPSHPLEDKILLEHHLPFFFETLSKKNLLTPEDSRLEEMMILIIDLVAKDCTLADGRLHHMFIGIYEEAFEFLEREGYLVNVGLEQYEWTEKDI